MNRIAIDCTTGEQSIVPLTAEEIAQAQANAAANAPTYADLRRREYPPIGDQLDALWKGGADAEAMRQQIMAVKAKYPKP